MTAGLTTSVTTGMTTGVAAMSTGGGASGGAAVIELHQLHFAFLTLVTLPFLFMVLGIGTKDVYCPLSVISNWPAVATICSDQFLHFITLLFSILFKLLDFGFFFRRIVLA